MFEHSKDDNKLKSDEFVGNLQTYEDNHHKKKKKKGIVVSSQHLKYLKYKSNSENEIYLDMVENYIKKYKNAS